jgi:uncharacterized pyridoxamine 5'-phosphate oxidase family protein
MDKKEIFEILNSNPVFHLATCEGDCPHTRGMLLYKADENGIVFHTGSMKDLYSQIKANPNAEMCFFDAKQNIQVRISGKLEEITGISYKDEIMNHPSRQFVKAWKDNNVFKDFYNDFKVFVLKNGTATTWSFASNFAPKDKVYL